VISEVDSGFATPSKFLIWWRKISVITIFFFSLGGISTGIIGIHSATVRTSLMMETAEKRRNPRPPGWGMISYFYSSVGDFSCYIEIV
jgi:hypothetical protein